MENMEMELEGLFDAAEPIGENNTSDKTARASQDVEDPLSWERIWDDFDAVSRRVNAY